MSLKRKRAQSGAAKAAAKAKGKARVARPSKTSVAPDSVRVALDRGKLLFEKCELDRSRESFVEALTGARAAGDTRAAMEALSGLLSLAGESQDQAEMDRIDGELLSLVRKHPSRVPPMVWYCRGAIHRHRSEYADAQKMFLKFLRASRASASAPAWEDSEELGRAWVMLAAVSFDRGHLERARWLADHVIRNYRGPTPGKIVGIAYLLLGRISEEAHLFEEAVGWYHKSHTAFLSEHHWFFHLYALFGYARIARQQQNYPQAYWYLDLVDKAASTPAFGSLRKQLRQERDRLEADAVDLLIDSRRGMIKTRESGQISLRKQYVLLHILEALSSAHGQRGQDAERGLSKAEIIERVWNESYRPEAHDNKLYYNINRLRKLIEPDMRQPQYLLNWKEGYRLAPGLRVHWVGERGGP
jgi:DNA-binding winged helix-turn-helix (wHTH) protein